VIPHVKGKEKESLFGQVLSAARFSNDFDLRLFNIVEIVFLRTPIA